MFARSEVIVLTDKQTPLKTSNALRYATTFGKNTAASKHTPIGGSHPPQKNTQNRKNKEFTFKSNESTTSIPSN